MSADNNSCSTKEEHNTYNLTESALFDGGSELLPAITESVSDNIIAADYCLPSFRHPSSTSSADSDSAVDDEEFNSTSSVEYDEDDTSSPSPQNTSSPKHVNPKFLSNIIALVVSCCCYNNSTLGHHTRRNLVWVQISLCVVTITPCFWFLPRLAVETTTDRTIVHRLIFLSGLQILQENFISSPVFGIQLPIYWVSKIYFSLFHHFANAIENPYFFLFSFSTAKTGLVSHRFDWGHLADLHSSSQ